ADGDGARQVLAGERVDGLQEDRPAFLPPLHQFLARGGGWLLELAVALAPGLLAVSVEELGPAREHVAAQVANDDGDAVGVLGRDGEHLREGELREGPVAGCLLGAEDVADGVEGLLLHAGYSSRSTAIQKPSTCRRLQPSAPLSCR